MTSHRVRAAGFSLIELMVVVAVISVLAALAAPDVNRARADAELGNAASALVRLGARARAHAAYTGLAHTVALIALPDGTQGFVLARGTSSRCNSVVWDFANLMSPVNYADSDNNDVVLRAARSSYSAGTTVMRIVPLNLDDPQICIQPNGRTLLRAGNGGLFTENVGGVTDVLFSLAHWRAGAMTSIDRQVVFPSGNAPRLVQ